MKLWPRSLAGRLAALLVLTLLLAQSLSLALFSGERLSALRHAFREDFFTRVVSLALLVEESSPELRQRALAATRSPMLRVALTPEPLADPEDDQESGVRARLAAALHKPLDDVRVDFARPPGRHWPGAGGRRGHGPPHPPPWANISVRLADGTWLNASAERPPVPPFGGAFLTSFLASAIAVAIVGALGIGWVSRPLRQLARASDRLGRGESFDPLPETGPQEICRANIAFNRMRERLDRYIRDRTTMLAAVAHDLRTPITTLRLRAEFIDDEEAKAKILETLEEMQVMAEGVLSFVRGDAQSEETRPTDVTALVESVVEDAAECGKPAIFSDSPAATLRCRPVALRRAVSNLIDNACFYGKRAKARVETGAEETRIVVEDDGPGIAEAELDRVFDPFVRLEGSRSRATGGAGLGLAITRSIARGHGGDVRLENRPEGGLRAVLSLPA